ncbi:hypothetical protein [Streptococcus halichoeri]|uniref:hypothetical protein n=1 Tax=Streptococcus halichoeri TaxID=254785 RepID=UPI001C8D92B2|nr:hypothetical protein [Streptococcus halichoeri]
MKISTDKTINQVASLTLEQSNAIENGLKVALKEFSENVIKEQKNSMDLVPISLYYNISLPFKSILLEHTYRGYYEQFYDDYLSPELANSPLSMTNEIFNQYKNKILEIKKLKELVDNIIKEDKTWNGEALKSELDIVIKATKKKANITPNFDYSTDTVDGIILSEDIPNLRCANEVTENLKALLYNYYDLTENKKELEKYNFQPLIIGNFTASKEQVITRKTIPHLSMDLSKQVGPKPEIPSQQLQASTTTAAQVIEEPQAISEPQEEVTVQTSLDDYTKSQINFWIEDFNTSLNKINYSGIYSENLESLITRGKQLRNKLDKALGENKSSDDIKRDLDQLEMISNTITSVGNTKNS